MALTGGRIVASIYGIDGNDLRFGAGPVNGRQNNFPVAGTIFYVAPLGTTAAGVTINSIIEVLPTGLRTGSTKYMTDSTTAQLVTNGS